MNIFIMNQYISKTATQRARILLTDNIQSGAAVVPTSIGAINTVEAK